MKRILAFVLCAVMVMTLIVSFSACSNGNIVGTWKLNLGDYYQDMVYSMMGMYAGRLGGDIDGLNMALNMDFDLWIQFDIGSDGTFRIYVNPSDAQKAANQIYRSASRYTRVDYGDIIDSLYSMSASGTYEYTNGYFNITSINGSRVPDMPRNLFKVEMQGGDKAKLSFDVKSALRSSGYTGDMSQADRIYMPELILHRVK